MTDWNQHVAVCSNAYTLQLTTKYIAIIVFPSCVHAQLKRNVAALVEKTNSQHLAIVLQTWMQHTITCYAALSLQAWVHISRHHMHCTWCVYIHIYIYIYASQSYVMHTCVYTLRIERLIQPSQLRMLLVGRLTCSVLNKHWCVVRQGDIDPII